MSRRLSVLSLAVALAGMACDPAPRPTGPSATPVLAASPTATAPTASAGSATPAPTPSGSVRPTAIDLPAGFDAIPWANMPPGDGNEDVSTVAIGVLGKPATVTRTFERQPDIAADGNAVILSDGRTSEIIDAATGDTIATFDHEALELNDVPRRDLSYVLFSRRFRMDVARGYLYVLGGNRDGVQLRRFALDGSDETRLGLVAPDPGTDPWYVDFVLTPSGDVVVTACSFDLEVPCRIYEADAGARRLKDPRFLRADAPRPCALLAADDRWLIGTNLANCRADGGPPAFMPYMAIDRSSLQTSVVTAPSGIRPFGLIPPRRQPNLLANLIGSYPYPNLYPPMAVELRFGDSQLPILDVGPGDGDLDTPGEGGPEVWSVAGRGPGWILFHGYGREYVACALEVERQERRTCPSGPVILETDDGTFELPPGTWGSVVPPLGFPGL